MSDRRRAAFVPGLEGVVATETRLSSVDGEAGALIIAGFPVGELASRATAEEMVYLLWRDALPDSRQLTTFREELAGRRALPGATLDLLRAAAAERASAMDALRMAADTTSLGVAEDSYVQALALVARLPTIAAAYWRVGGWEGPGGPHPQPGHPAKQP